MLVQLERMGRVATVTLNRPEARNALSAELCDALLEAVESVQADGQSRAIVLRGQGMVFCSGADFAAVSGPDALAFLPAFERMLEAVARCRLPVIAAVHGAALGGGLQLAAVCDFRVIAEDARLGVPSSRLGIVVNFENVQRLVLLAGIARAKEIMMTGRTFTGAEAERMGLATSVVGADEVLESATALAREIAGLAPLSVQGTKRAIQVVTGSLSDAREARRSEVEAIDALVAEAYRSEDLQEGLRAQSERRPPDFHGR